MDLKENRIVDKKGGPIVLVGLGFLVLLCISLRTISHSECWTNLSIGRSIAEAGIPRTAVLALEEVAPPLSTVNPSAWVDTHWLYDLILFGVWSAGQAPLTILVHGVVLLAAFLLLLPVARRFGGATSISLALLISGWILAYTYSVRPVTFSLLFAAGFVYTLHEVKRTRLCWAILIPLQVLWTNCHVSFFLGPVIVLIFALQSWLAERRGEPASGCDFRVLTPLVVLLMLATFLNPYGPLLHTWLFKDYRLSKLLLVWNGTSPIAEQFPGTFTRNSFYFSLLVAAGGLLTYKKKLPLAITLLGLLTVFLAVMSFRFYDLFALLAFPFFVLSLRSLGSGLIDLSTGVLKEPKRLILAGGRVFIGLAVIVSLFALVTNRYYVAVGSFSSFGLSAVEEAFPHDASRVLFTDEAFPLRMAHLPIDGGYLHWHHPERGIYIDERLDAYGAKQYVERVHGIVGGDSDAWKRVTEKWQPKAVLINACMKKAALGIHKFETDPNWRLAWFDGTSAVYLDRDPAHEKFLADQSLRQSGLDRLEQERTRYAGKINGLVKPAIPPRLVGAGVMYMSLRFYREAYAVYELLTRGAPNMSSAWLNQGIAALQLSRHEVAVESLEKAMALDRKNALSWLWLSQAYLKAKKPDSAHVAFENGRRINPELAESMARAWGYPIEPKQVP